MGLGYFKLNSNLLLNEDYQETIKKCIAVIAEINKVSKGTKTRNRYNQVPHLTQDTNGKVTNSQ